MKKRLLIDISHILKANLHVAKGMDSARFVEFEGKEVPIPDKHEGYDLFLTSLLKTLKTLDMTPRQCVLVKDGYNCKAMRREFLPGYCMRPPGPPEFSEVFRECQDLVEDTLLKYGAISVSKEGIEADDIIAAFAATMPHIIWSGDKDLLTAGDVFYDGEINADKFFGIAKKHIVVYKSLVGDPSDKIPGCKGFGDKAFVDMVAKYGDEALDELLEMLGEKTLDQLEQLADEFKPFQKVLDNLDTVYASYQCAKFHHPGWYGFDWRMKYPGGNGELKEWEPSIELITADNLTPEFLARYQRELNAAPYNSFDIETYTTEEGKAWCERNKNKQGRKPLDVLGQVLTGFSVNTGVNCEKTYYFTVDHADTNNLSLAQAEQLLNMFPEDTPTIVHNSGFELPVIRMHFELRYDRGWLPPMLYDTKILSGYVNEYEPSNLKYQSKTRLGYEQTTYEQVVTQDDDDGEAYMADMNQLSGIHVLQYGADDSICAGALFNLYELITHFEDSWKAYEEIDVVPPFLYSERFINGIGFDLKKLEELHKESMEKYEKYYGEIQEFLKTLTWEESRDLPKQVITVEDLKAGLKPQAEASEVIVHKWPGCEFIPAVELTPAEIKRLYLGYTGKKLKTNVRLLDKLANEIPELEFAEMVSTEDLAGLNNLCREAFKPSPQLGLRSPKDMEVLLYEALGLPVRVRNKPTDNIRAKGIKQGNPSTGEPAIQHAIVYDVQDDAAKKDFLEAVLEAKSCLTEEGLYFNPYRNMPHYLDGMVHPQFAVAAQKSGRGTASGPNDAQVARGSGIRKVYIPHDSGDPDDPYVWVSMDMSSQELVHVAEHCKDPAMMDCFRGERRDIHSITGARIYNLEHPDAQVTYEEFKAGVKTDPEMKAIRKEPAKRTNFLKVYNGTERTLAIKLLISEAKAKDMIDVQSQEFPGIDKWIESSAETNLARGYAVTPYGRRRHFGYVMDGTWKDNHEVRAGGNHPIQGGAAEQIKRILIRLWQERVYDIFDAIFVGTVHDEVNSLVRKSQVIEFVRYGHPIMTQQFADFELQFQSSIEIGPNFGELTEIGTEFDEKAIQEFLEGM